MSVSQGSGSWGDAFDLPLEPAPWAFPLPLLPSPEFKAPPSPSPSYSSDDSYTTFPWQKTPDFAFGGDFPLPQISLELEDLFSGASPVSIPAPAPVDEWDAFIASLPPSHGAEPELEFDFDAFLSQDCY